MLRVLTETNNAIPEFVPQKERCRQVDGRIMGEQHCSRQVEFSLIILM